MTGRTPSRPGFPGRPLAAVAAASVAALATLAPAAVEGQAPVNRVTLQLTEDGPVRVERFADTLAHPWGLAFLPDGRLLVTERPGRLRIVGTDGKLSPPVGGTPEVFAQGQGGLLDVALDPDFARNGHVWLSYAAPGPEGRAASALGRGTWRNDSIVGFQRLFLQEPWVERGLHFGGRIVFDRQGHVFLTLGERFQYDPAQDLANHLGTVVRLGRDGSVPRDNPFVGRANAQGAIWSYGHRNIESAALHPATGALWVGEMGPLGGDELNVAQAGKNHGWPVVSWGIRYDGTDIPDPPTRPEFADAIHRWSPVISPSGMLFYSGAMFPAWRGNAFIGSLTQHGLVRLETDGRTITGQELIPMTARIRDVEQGPDGALYVAVDREDGAVWKVVSHQVKPAGSQAGQGGQGNR